MGIQLEHVDFRIGEFSMSDLSLAVREGEYFVLTGPNGSGKTVLIKLIAGLRKAASGVIRLGGADVTHMPPWKRNIGYVPQEELLFPHRSVRGNIGFGLEVRGIGGARIQAAVEKTAQLLGIAHLLDRQVDGLSGGERQKAALARALAFEPRVLLLDEPVSAIDEGTRGELCRELRRLQRELGLTVLHISHNQQETTVVADRVGVMAGGQIRSIAEVQQ